MKVRDLTVQQAIFLLVAAIAVFLGIMFLMYAWASAPSG